MMRRLSLVPALLLTLAVLLGGCGDDSEGASPTTTAAEEDGAETTGQSEATGQSETTEESETTEDSKTTEGEGDLEAFCTTAEDLETLTEGMADETLEDLQSGVAQLLEGAEELADAAPEEVADDVATLVKTVEALKEAVDDAGSVEEAETALEDLSGQGDFAAAGERVQTFTQENC